MKPSGWIQLLESNTCKTKANSMSRLLVPGTGIEPALPFENKILSRV